MEGVGCELYTGLIAYVGADDDCLPDGIEGREVGVVPVYGPE